MRTIRRAIESIFHLSALYNMFLYKCYLNIQKKTYFILIKIKFNRQVILNSVAILSCYAILFFYKRQFLLIHLLLLLAF